MKKSSSLLLILLLYLKKSFNVKQMGLYIDGKQIENPEKTLTTIQVFLEVSFLF